MIKDVRLTTFDNPFDPFDQFDDWFTWDELNGHHTCGYLGRIAHVNDSMTEQEENEEVERAIDEIIKYDPFNKYKKVVRETADDSEEIGDTM